jgi:hypothetical protein
MSEEDYDMGGNKKKDLTEELLDSSFQSVRISSSTDGSLAQEIKKSFVKRLAVSFTFFTLTVPLKTIHSRG